MSNENLKERTKRFAINVIKLVEKLPKNQVGNVLGRQLLRAGTSVGANYRAACRARSRADFISKMGIVEEEIDETLYWLELLLEAKLVDLDQIKHLIKEANEILSIVVTSIKTARRRTR
ncbi:MAG: four helix bundle protein [bacterium]